MSQQIFDAFTAQCRAKLREAVTKFGCTFDPEKVVINLDVRGQSAGQARLCRATNVYSMRFNPEAILKYNDLMTDDTIPHEIAHLVCFNLRHLGKNHNDGWKRVCRMLGGDDSRTHDMVLEPAKIVPSRRQKYNLPDGRVCEVGPKHHQMIQSGCTTIFMRNPKVFLRAEMWERYTSTPKAVPKVVAPSFNIVRSDIPALPQLGSKREKAEAIYKANKHLARKDVIMLFVDYADMTKSGAATYYQNFKSKGI